MIHRFSVANYGSIREKVTLDLRIPGTAPDLACFRRSLASPDVRLPAVAVLMGPNGSGKTTLLRALVELGRVVSFPTATLHLAMDSWRPPPFQSVQTRWKPTVFSLEGESDFLAPGKNPQRFRYELTIGRQRKDDDTEGPMFVKHEALVHFPRGRHRRLIERSALGTSVYVSREFGLTARDDRLQAIDPNRSAIATLALVNVPVAKRFATFLRDLLVGATNIAGTDTFAPDTPVAINWVEASSDASGWVEAQIQRSDLGIEKVEIADGYGGRYIRFRHSALDGPVVHRSESKGTRRLVHLLPLIKFALDVTGVAILDEIDGDLHVAVLGEILNHFRSRESNPRRAQLLMSSHQVGLLEDLEKEELFILERDDSGATRVYGAQDVRGLRRDVRLYPKYRAGVLGGLPKIG